MGKMLRLSGGIWLVLLTYSQVFAPHKSVLSGLLVK